MMSSPKKGSGRPPQRKRNGNKFKPSRPKGSAPKKSGRGLPSKSFKPFPIDSRDPKTTHSYNSSDLVPSLQSTAITSPSIMYDSIAAIVLPVCSVALQKGFNAYAGARSSPSLLYHAYVYMVKLLESYVLNATPRSTEVPIWLACVGNALRPKSVGFKSGSLECSWQYVQDSQNYDSKFLFGNNNVVNRVTFFLYPSSNTIDNGYNTCVAPQPYTDALGETAFGALVAFFNTRAQKLWRLVPWDKGGRFNSDVSAFAFPIPIMGLGAGSGAWGLTAGNEVPILHPLLSCTADPEYKLVRYPKHYRNLAGDPSFYSGLLQHAQSTKILKMKNQVVLKGIDFYEFVEVISLWIQGLFNSAMKSNLTGSYSTSLNVSWSDYLIALRSFFVFAFGSTQHLVEGLYPKRPATNNESIFMPFAVGSNCYSCDDAASLMIPVNLAENIRCLSARMTYPGKNPKTGKRNYNDPLIYIPVLGAYSSFTLDPTLYNYVNREGQSTSLFLNTTPPNISMFDGSKGNIPMQISLSGTVALTVSRINAVVQEFSSYSAKLDKLGDAQGINALEVITMTNIVPASTIDIVKGQVVRKYSHVTEATYGKTDKERDLMSTYETAPIIAITSQTPPRKDAWDQIQILWIKPVFTVSIGSTQEQNSDLYSLQCYANEPFADIKKNSENPNSIIASRFLHHKIYSSNLIKGPTSTNLIQDDLFEYWAKTGRGGLLSSLVGNLISKIPI